MTELVYPENYPYIKCLDKGFVALIDHMGSDARIVQAARVSYQTGTKAVQSDRHLIRYMLRHHHETPFEKVVFEFHVKLPVFVARQWMRHRISSYNEISGRYSVMKDEFYRPDPLRKQSSTNRQGSSDDVVDEIRFVPDNHLPTSPEKFFDINYLNAYGDYETLLNNGAARELARIVLPLSTYTEFYWTVNLRSLMNFLMLRADSHAQYEIRVFADAILKLIEENCELQYAIEAFQDYIVDDPRLTKFELEVIRDVIMELKKAGNVSGFDLLLSLDTKIAAHPDMSKREKAESKLKELLFPEKSNDQIQSDVPQESPPDSGSS